MKNSQSDVSISQSEASSVPPVDDMEHIPEETLSQNGSKISLLSQQATKLHNPQQNLETIVQDQISTKFQPSVTSEQILSQSIGLATPKIVSQSVPKYPLSLSRSIPKSIPRRSSLKPATPTSLFLQAHRKSILESDSDHDADISEHLVRPGETQNAPGASFGSMSHSLVGGAITRDIYKWHEDRETQTRPRRNSEPDMINATTPTDPTVADIREPGGFRRDFIRNRAKEAGKKPPNFVTGNFIDFLILYGFYGGDVYPSDDEDEDEDDEMPGYQPSTHVDDIEAAESAPLLQRQPSSTIKIKGTSEPKAFFMLLKAFVGTGVLFLPKAFMNGGIIFSIVIMCIFGYLTTHCMLLLVETSRKFGGKSFGDLGQTIYGENCRLLILGSIAVSQMVI